MTDKKKFTFGEDAEWKQVKILETKPDPYTDLLYDYQKQAMKDLYSKHIGTNLCNEITLPYTGAPAPVTSKPSNAQLTTKNQIPSYSMTVKDLQDMIKHLNVPSSIQPSRSGYPKTYWGDYETYFKAAPMVDKHEKKVEVTLDDGSIESISREELIKYIGERKIIRENEIVRKVYERYQVAVKLVRSDDNGDTGV